VQAIYKEVLLIYDSEIVLRRILRAQNKGLSFYQCSFFLVLFTDSPTSGSSKPETKVYSPAGSGFGSKTKSN